MSIGDVNSAARGSGARYNAGKPEMELIPARLIARSFPYAVAHAEHRVLAALDWIGQFQVTGDPIVIDAALSSLSDHWEDCAAVFAYGRQKYAAWNWLKGMPWSSVIGCAVRHCVAILRGEERDAESGLPHKGHLMCNLVMLRTFVDTYPEGNDLPPASLFESREVIAAALDSVSMDPPPIVDEAMAEAFLRDILLTRAESDDDAPPAYDAKPLGRMLNPPSNDEE